MKDTTRLELSEAQHEELEKGYRNGTSHCYRMRCLAVLLRAGGMTLDAVGGRTEMGLKAVRRRVARYKAEGVKGLETRPGRGRKPIMDSSDEEAVRRAVGQDRQSVNRAREAWQRASGKEASESTFKRCLSALAQDTSV